MRPRRGCSRATGRVQSTWRARTCTCWWTSLVIAALVLPRAWQLMVRSARVMLEHVPAGFDADEVEHALRQVEGAMDTHDLHLWSLDGVSVLATVHVVAAPGVDRDQLLDRVQVTLAQLGVEHATVQIELPEHIGHEKVC